MATLTVYPDPDVESTSVDGWINKIDGTWATAHDATSGDTASPSGAQIATRVAYDAINYTIWRGAMLFDTSAIPDDATIDSAILSIWVVTKYTQNNDSVQRLVTTTPASNTDIVLADYDQFGTVAQANDIAIADTTTGQYNDFTLNATGKGNISKTGISKFGIREVTYDISNVAPASGGSDGIDYYSADQTETANDPKLVINYTEATSFRPHLMTY